MRVYCCSGVVGAAAAGERSRGRWGGADDGGEGVGGR